MLWVLSEKEFTDPTNEKTCINADAEDPEKFYVTQSAGDPPPGCRATGWGAVGGGSQLGEVRY